MIAKPALFIPGLVGLSLMLVVLAPAHAMGDQDDPPTRVARVAYLNGSVSFQPGGTEDWVAPPVNRPLTTGDRLWSDRDGRVELQLGGSFLRLGSNSAVSFLNLGNSVTQIQLSAGTLLVRVRRLDDDETYEIDTPNLAFSILRPGLYRLTVDDTLGTTTVGVRSGQGEVTGAGTSYSLRAGERNVFSGTDALVLAQQGNESREDAFDAWSASRDGRWERSPSVRYVSPDVVGSEDLDEYGAWRPTPEYGNVWFPRGVAAGWAPYHDGHWAYVEPWGYTWVDDSQWGYAPFHYGRWISVQGAWGWVPAPPRQEGGVYVRAVYAPALVAWVGVGVGIAWFALGPREVYVPSYPVSRGYVHDINVSNTTVNTTVVNNIYNTTIVNKTVNTTNVTYVNRTVPGAVIGTTAQAFASAQPVARNVVRVDERAVASAPVRAFAPTTAPTKQAVLGSGHATEAKPPAAVQTRAVVARTPPPPPPPAFEQRQEALRGNAGRPLSVAQVRQIPASGAPPVAAVRIAPPARLIAAPAPAPAPAGTAGMPPVRPANPTSETARPALAPIHPKDIPVPARPPAPTSSGSILEQQHVQEQQQLHAQQETERQRVQQQHDLEHAQLAKQQADEAQRQQVELQHRQQTQQLMQKHAQEQQQQLEQHQQQQRQQESQRPTQDRRSDRPPSQATEAARPVPAPVHPNEIPVAPRPPSPANANSVLERQHLQEQQQLHAQQETERQRVQQQHDLEHAQLAKQQADEARRQQVELQHQQATQQLMQKHAQEQQQMLEKHQQQQQQQDQPPKGSAPVRPPGTRP